MEEQEYIELRPQPKVALLTYGDYVTLNYELSVAKGYDLTGNTQRCLTTNPLACKINIQLDSDGNELSHEVRYLANISSEIQVDYPDIIAGIELVDGYTPVDEPVTEIEVDINDINVLQWALSHFVSAGSDESGATLILSDTTKSLLTADMIEAVSNLGLTII